MMRVGQGLDVHAFSDDDERVLVLGGVHFVGERGLSGHSDADVVAHACADALLGACDLGDIGAHFPDTDERWRAANSIDLLSEVVRMIAARGWQPINIDCTVMCESPTLSAHRDEMRQRLSGAVGAPVSVKGTRPEGLGSLGRGEGIACWAVALVEGP